MQRYEYLIIGGGMTADAAAHGIRELDTTGSIGIISSETDPPYNRPPLSKALWKGEPESSVWRNTSTATATLHLGRTATRIDAATHVVTDDRAEAYEYGSLLLATGASPRRFSTLGDGTIYYRTLADFHRLRDETQEGDTVGVVGAGFIGAEVAAALAMNGRKVVMFFPEDGICSRIFPKELAQFLVGYYREKGVDVRSGSSIARVTGTDAAFELQSSAGDAVAVKRVVAGVGVVPNVKLAEDAGAAIDNGVLVDSTMRTSVRGVFAAGDVANFPSVALGARVRVEHEDNANSMGRAAGRSMAGDKTPYTHLPFFYSDMFDLGYEAVGQIDSALDTFTDWKEPYREGVVFYFGNGVLKGVLLWNVWGKVDAARELIAARRQYSESELRGRFFD